CSSPKVWSIWRMAMTLAAPVTTITASTSMKLPKVIWPIESDRTRLFGGFGGVSAVIVETGLQSAPIYDVFPGWGNMLKTVTNPARGPAGAGAPSSRNGFQPQSAVIPASLTTLAHSATSALMMSAKTASGALLGSQPAVSSFCWTSEVARAASSAALIL